MNENVQMMPIEQLMTSLDQNLKTHESLKQQVVLALSSAVSSMTPDQLHKFVVVGSLTSAASMPVPAPVAVPLVSNVVRSASGRRPLHIVDGRPSLSWSMRVILKEAGHALHGDDIFAALKAYGWLPKGADPRKRVAHALSQQKKIFLRDKKAGRGFYFVSPTDEVPVLPSNVKRARALPALTRNPKNDHAPEAVASAPAVVPAAKKTRKVAAKKPSHKPLAERKETMAPVLRYLLANDQINLVASTDIAKALRIEQNEMQGPLIALLRCHAFKATGTNDEGKTLYTVNRKKLISKGDWFEETKGVKVFPKAKKAAAKPAKKAVAKAAPAKAVAKAASKKHVAKKAAAEAATAEAPAAAAG